MTLRLFNTRTRQKEVFEPIEPGHARVYSCGPTVYAPQHIGNLRPYLFADLLKRALLADVMEQVRARGFAIGNVDATVIAQVPRLAPFREAIVRGVARALDVDPSRVSVKVTSTDGLGAIGRGDGIAAQAVVLLERAESA